MSAGPAAGSVSPLAWGAWTVISAGGVWSCPDVRDELVKRQRATGHTKPGRYGRSPVSRPTLKSVYRALEELVRDGHADRTGNYWRKTS